MLAVCHEPRFAELPPSQIVPRLADEGTYLASKSVGDKLRLLTLIDEFTCDAWPFAAPAHGR